MTSRSADTLRSRYVAQAASDLEDNRRRQRELAEKMKMLEQEEALLVDILNLAERYEGSSAPPEQAREEPAAARAEERSRPASGRTPARGETRTGTPAGKSAAKGKSRQPLLGDLLLRLLGGRTCRRSRPASDGHHSAPDARPSSP
ncbi:hypothetical protein, partial [Streptomyces minutiscleroticus]|uniref:hypothetical protein n=1 Tax=Streptomyces minutiscleroticus TaxID=68238 RepID=UPI00332530E2